ncbi:MAG: MoaD/ThiS family protein [Promethearchaeota archaeon]|jgi:molybdopterin converting factor small subunit
MKIEKNRKMISVTVKFFASLREYGPADELLIIPENSRIEMLFEKYNIPGDQRKTIIIVNGRPHQNLETILKDKDIVSIFPPIGGG